jgi:hypothetical protein
MFSLLSTFVIFATVASGNPTGLRNGYYDYDYYPNPPAPHTTRTVPEDGAELTERSFVWPLNIKMFYFIGMFSSMAKS